MIIKISRLFIILIVILVSAVYIPEYYWLSFEKKTPSPMAYYSPILENYLIAYYDDGFYYKTKDGKRFTRDEADPLLPFFNYRILAAKGQMPDSIKGHKVDLKEIRLNNLFIRIRPKHINVPVIPLYPLMEANPPRLSLSIPDDFFRITPQGIEFINAATNELNTKKSEKFTRALKDEGFVFPAQKVFGNITTRKPFDEGYFIVDKNGQLFHLKMIDGEPFCRNTHKPDSIDVRVIFINERDLREFYGVVIDTKNQVYFLMYDQYRFQKIPISNYNPDEDNLYILGNLMYRIFNIKKDTQLLSFTTNRQYQLIATYQESWPGFYQSTAGIITKYFFPFTLQIRKSTTEFASFYFDDFSPKAIIFNVLLLFLAMYIFKKRRQKIKNSWFDLVIILVTGIYGFIGVSLFEPPVD
ncbi:hypothetical protein Calab_3519 [Caldithrix abyssi DSM 13497]|uniref:DUF4857 domain-containing protein n=1 Tax=Caldithrix abyssi DSM 13497 TaxID=880073 RepID=H1XXJ4_CALAY|nr:DUF4857 domain-containing protein [Caldithrix abyssi]APF19207.1 protein of unknown function (DUF4857) [Caldithrix abyssi DSM 13497]EHO43118.1 hypothetical protein Calab_3519 [Caldithrix abyssi DSM 13497]